LTDALSISAIPHRPPFLFVDSIIEVSSNRIQTQYVAHARADYFRGHYPGRPIMPGVLLCECCFQAAALLMVHRSAEAVSDHRVPMITRIQDAKFRRVVKPGDSLNVEAVLEEIVDDVLFFTGRIAVEGKPALRLSFAAVNSRPDTG